MRKSYPSDITREQFAVIEPILLSARKKTSPRKLDLYEVFCGVLHIVHAGSSWRALPHDFPKWSSVRYYFDVWSEQKDEEPSILEQALQQLVGDTRVSNGRNKKTSFCIVDAQSVKNTDTAENKGYDAGKKVSGIKRHIAVDTQGLPHAIHVTTADVSDREGAISMVSGNAKENLSEVENILVDGGYTGEPFAAKIKETIRATVEVAKRNELHKFAVIPQRWVVERTFGWLNKYRRLWRNCERKINTSLQMIVLAFIRLILKRL